MTVTASRTKARLGDTPARMVVIGGEELQSVAGPTLDDALRQVPGFSLFRRSDSRVANPTAQGASLRGVGASGASRALVLLDGVPLNDPFGGWVYWSREPRVGIERVEVMEGGASDLYGSAAMGGVIQALERTDASTLAVEASGGSLATGTAALYAATRRGAWTLRGSGEAFTTDGYVLVPADQSGPVDTAAGGRHISGNVSLERRVSPTATVFVRGAALGESRTNGTPAQVNDTDWQQVSAGADVAGDRSALSIRTWYATQTYHQTFSAVSADRTTEALTRLQRVPSSVVGLGLQWSRQVAAGHQLVAGVDGRWVEGRSDETGYAQGRPTASTSVGGHDRSIGVFASDRAALGSRTVATLGARLDRWSGGERDVTAVSPRASVLVRASSRLTFTAAGYGAFRAPTLNELHRSFRVGNTLTLANPDLTDERLWGGEAGLAWRIPGDRLRLRAVGFSSRVEDPVANVTLRTTPQLITRERQNLGRTRSRGVETDAEARLGRWLQVSAGYAFIDAVVTSFSASPDLVGNQLPQVPRHQATFAIRFSQPRVLQLSLGSRVSSEQFDDDQNQLPLPGYLTIDARASRQVGRASIFAVVENVTDKRYAVGLTPTPTIGPPRSFRAGVRFE